MNYFSELKIFYSNCRYNGNAWTQAQSELMTNLKNALDVINDLEFKGFNVNTMRGETQNFQVTVLSTYRKLKSDIDFIESLNLNEIVRLAASKVKGFIFEEVRIEHTRHRSIYENFNNAALIREF